MAEAAAFTLWAPHAWLTHEGRGQWRRSVVLGIGNDGCWTHVIPEASPPPEAVKLDGPVLPGLVNAHSHAFQRAFAGLAESREDTGDDFWSWRDRMYRAALRIDPDSLRAIATQLYCELLQGGYTEVCEFHYLHRAPNGARYGDPLAMSHALVEAAVAAGIGLTLLPVLYERAGFDASTLRADQRRFAASVDEVLALRDGIRALNLPQVGAGIAIHSLRAASPASIAALTSAIANDDAPVHVHVAEQLKEVEDCISATGRRPIEWLASEVALDPRWQLVHATHATPSEIAAVAHAGAGVVICPTTEANLGDGIFDLPRWLDADVALSIGSDSQVTRAWWEELRMLEYSQRLLLRRRNIAADHASPSTASRLFDMALSAGGRAGGKRLWGLVPGARADLLVLDSGDHAMLGIAAAHGLDVAVFSSPCRPVRDVMVGGRWRIRGTLQTGADRMAREQDFTTAMHALWA